MTRLTLMLAAGLVCFAAFGQEKPAAMSMPRPAAEMKELRDLIGVWNSDENLNQVRLCRAAAPARASTPFAWARAVFRF